MAACRYVGLIEERDDGPRLEYRIGLYPVGGNEPIAIAPYEDPINRQERRQAQQKLAAIALVIRELPDLAARLTAALAER